MTKTSWRPKCLGKYTEISQHKNRFGYLQGIYQGWTNYDPRAACCLLNIFCGLCVHRAYLYIIKCDNMKHKKHVLKYPQHTRSLNIENKYVENKNLKIHYSFLKYNLWKLALCWVLTEQCGPHRKKFAHPWYI